MTDRDQVSVLRARIQDLEQERDHLQASYERVLNEHADLFADLLRAGAAVTSLRTALQDIAWQNLYPEMAKIAQAALAGRDDKP